MSDIITHPTSEYKHKCPRCESTDHYVMGQDYWDDEDVATYMACLKCNLLYWHSTYFGKISTNGRESNLGKEL